MYIIHYIDWYVRVFVTYCWLGIMNWKLKSLSYYDKYFTGFATLPLMIGGTPGPQGTPVGNHCLQDDRPKQENEFDSFSFIPIPQYWTLVMWKNMTGPVLLSRVLGITREKNKSFNGWRVYSLPQVPSAYKHLNLCHLSDIHFNRVATYHKYLLLLSEFWNGLHYSSSSTNSTLCCQAFSRVPVLSMRDILSLSVKKKLPLLLM